MIYWKTECDLIRNEQMGSFNSRCFEAAYERCLSGKYYHILIKLVTDHCLVDAVIADFAECSKSIPNGFSHLLFKHDMKKGNS